ncbi:MAG: Bcr/CflA family drug resistance efflux transporter [Micavibrio aeruginosavorus]|uniref:Bcr/CflA family drug resistance efflux transporter n=1 Tax=Micavibrio aeruginosavorus TaxID=349221 RepID=A0A2W5N970_9BACT|nr:MAG: Bcr/CflA family drug resistance efflux transporter [Micavibrio aeruginosavorus]
MASLMSIVAISIDAMMPALGIMGGDLNVAFPNQVQFIIVFIFVGMGIGELFFGPLSDAIGRKKVLYCGFAIYILGSLVCYLAHDIDMLLVGRVIQGIGVSAPYVTAVAIVRDKFSGNEMARIMSLVMMIFILVPAIAPMIGQGLLFIASWRALFILYIVMALALSVWVYFRLEETLHPEDKIPFSMKAIFHGFGIVFKTRVTVCYTLAMGLCFGSFFGYLNSCQQIFMERYAVGTDFSLYFGGLALVLGAASLFNSRIVKKFTLPAICAWSTMGIIAASSLFLVVNLLMDVPVWMFVAYAGAVFFAFGLLFGNLNAVAMEPMGHLAGIAAAVTGAMTSAMSTVAGSVIGQMYDGTLMPVAAGFLVLNIFSLIAIKFGNLER